MRLIKHRAWGQRPWRPLQLWDPTFLSHNSWHSMKYDTASCMLIWINQDLMSKEPGNSSESWAKSYAGVLNSVTRPTLGIVLLLYQASRRSPPVLKSLQRCWSGCQAWHLCTHAFTVTLYERGWLFLYWNPPNTSWHVAELNKRGRMRTEYSGESRDLVMVQCHFEGKPADPSLPEDTPSYCSQMQVEDEIRLLSEWHGRIKVIRKWSRFHDTISSEKP